MRTDLAREAREWNRDIPGVSERVEKLPGAEVSYIQIETEQAAAALDKPRGAYVTIEVPGIALRDAKAFETAAACVSSALKHLTVRLKKLEHVLVVGLGNRFVTPDALGPRTVEKLFVTRHIHCHAPELAPRGMRQVSAIAPGVLGVTGIETAEAVRALVEALRPDCLFCIDALASARASRISTAIQLNESGILPGAGVGNRQRGLSERTLGLPVIAIGVPTVVYAATIAFEALLALGDAAGAGGDESALKQSVDEMMDRRFPDMIVTPKDVDQLVSDAAGVLASGINRMLHEAYFQQIETLLR